MAPNELHSAFGLLDDGYDPLQLATILQEQINDVGAAAREENVREPDEGNTTGQILETLPVQIMFVRLLRTSSNTIKQCIKLTDD